MTDNHQILEEIKAPEAHRLARALRDETTGGLLLIATSIFALLWANSMWSHSYHTFINFSFGPSSIHLHLSVGQWAADFLLAIFFFVIGTELKHEIVHGSLANTRQASVPIVAAVCGMIVAASIFLIFNHGVFAQKAWGIPISTDVAFALAILAIAGKALPLELRSFLLTVAVVNDLCAIIVIAIFYGHGFHLSSFLLATLVIFIIAVLQYKQVTTPLIFVPLALAAWYFMFQSGIHATIAGVAVGLAMRANSDRSGEISPAQNAESFFRPISAGLCVPLFALVSIGVTLSGSSFHEMIADPLTLGILYGLIIGQPIGVTLGAYLTTKVTNSQLNPALSWADVAVVGTLASIGFTVALLVAEVSFSENETSMNTAKFAIILTNVIAMAVSVTAIRLRKSRLT